MKHRIPTLKEAAIIACLFVSRTLMAQKLHTSGHDMVDESRNKLLLQGIGLGNWMLPCGRRNTGPMNQFSSRPLILMKTIIRVSLLNYMARNGLLMI